MRHVRVAGDPASELVETGRDNLADDFAEYVEPLGRSPAHHSGASAIQEKTNHRLGRHPETRGVARGQLPSGKCFTYSALQAA